MAAVTNFTGRDRRGIHLVKRLAADNRFILKRVFTPEHGFNSDAPDGEHVADSVDSSLGIEIVSLYGEVKKPSLELLQDIDLLVYDIQDVGTRFYTYISTLRNVIEAADEAGRPVAVLDRPDVLGGSMVEGPMLSPEFASFVGHLPIALRYGLTPGELARWWCNKQGIKTEVKVYKCQNYACPSNFNSLGFPWFKPSPSMPDITTALFYPGTCLFEGTDISEGRGTDTPFRAMGAPWINANIWAEALKPLLPEDIKVTTTSFVPTFSKFSENECRGILLETVSGKVDNAVYIGVASIYALMQSHPGKIVFTDRPGMKYPFIDYLAGTDRIRKGLLKNEKPSQIVFEASDGTEEFKNSRVPFFLYQRG
ncbi:MAG: DUF1343 domain-containing protein [Candidatus Riflebacteria bacterium]|nr:DUF1343 domain-containing protein [Candidatus Riflebacteria bacterium]